MGEVMQLDSLKTFAEKTNNLLSNINNNQNSLIEPNFYAHSINLLITQYKKINQYTNENRIEFINELKNIHTKILKGESFENLYDSSFVGKIKSFIEYEQKLNDLYKDFANTIDSSLVNLNEVAKQHKYDIITADHYLSLENIKFKHDDNIEKLNTSKTQLLKDLHDLQYTLLHMHVFNKKGDRYFYDEKTVQEKRIEAEELIKYSVNIYLLEATDDNLNVLTKNYLNKFSLQFKNAYSEIIRRDSERNMAKEYLDCQKKISNATLHSFLAGKLLTENADSILENDTKNSKVIIFKDGSILAEKDSQLTNIININDFKNKILEVINDKLEALVGENKNIFNNLIDKDLSNIFNVLDAAIKYNENIGLFTTDEIANLNSQDVIPRINDKVYNKNVDDYIKDTIKPENVKYISEETRNIIKTIYDCDLPILNNFIKHNVEDIKNIEDLNVSLIRSHNLFNRFNKEEYLIKADSMKNNIIKTDDNTLIIEIKNHEQLNFFTNGDHYIKDAEELKSIKHYSAYPYLVFDFDKLPKDKTSAITIIFDVKKDIHEYSLKSDTRAKRVVDDQYKDLIDLIKSKNPKAKAKAKLKM